MLHPIHQEIETALIDRECDIANNYHLFVSLYQSDTLLFSLHLHQFETIFLAATVQTSSPSSLHQSSNKPLNTK
jgi:hypothetical protein